MHLHRVLIVHQIQSAHPPETRGPGFLRHWRGLGHGVANCCNPWSVDNSALGHFSLVSARRIGDFREGCQPLRCRCRDSTRVVILSKAFAPALSTDASLRMSRRAFSLGVRRS